MKKVWLLLIVFFVITINVIAQEQNTVLITYGTPYYGNGVYYPPYANPYFNAAYANPYSPYANPYSPYSFSNPYSNYANPYSYQNQTCIVTPAYWQNNVLYPEQVICNY
jgi:hypothetical protein